MTDRWKDGRRGNPSHLWTVMQFLLSTPVSPPHPPPPHTHSNRRLAFLKCFVGKHRWKATVQKSSHENHFKLP